MGGTDGGGGHEQPGTEGGKPGPRRCRGRGLRRHVRTLPASLMWGSMVPGHDRWEIPDFAVPDAVFTISL